MSIHVGSRVSWKGIMSNKLYTGTVTEVTEREEWIPTQGWHTAVGLRVREDVRGTIWRSLTPHRVKELMS